jgi:predicted transcriptional regulator
MSLLGVMTDKGLLSREPKGRAFVYRAKVGREKTLGQMVDDLLTRAFEGSASTLVARLLDQSSPSPQELEEIRKALDEYRRQQGEE